MVQLTAEKRQRLHDGLSAFADRTTHSIKARISAYAGPDGGARHRLIHLAVKSAMSHFLHTIEAEGHPSNAGVSDLYRRMAWGEVDEGKSLVDLEEAITLAHVAALQYLIESADRGLLPRGSLVLIAHDLAAFIGYLREEIQTGADLNYASPLPDRSQRTLIRSLFAEDEEAIARQAEHHGWNLPDRAVVLLARPGGSITWPASGLSSFACDLTAEHAIFLVAPDKADDLAAELRGLDPALQIARSLDVPLLDVGHARHWATRLFDLADLGVIPQRPVLDADVETTQLWLQGEPVLRRELVRLRLAPLSTEGRASQTALTQTLLTWLVTRESAPELARRLGIHPQTVRYRWRRISELFGADMQDPGTLMQLWMVLQSSVPRWNAGADEELAHWRGR
jgi:hypothetical protein